VAASDDQFLFSMKSTEDNWTSITALLASLYRDGATIKWPRFHRPFLSSLTLLRLPTYAFDEKNYWKAYVERNSPSQTSSATNKSLATIPQFSTTSLQWVEAEEVRGSEVSATFASRTSEPNFFAAIQGHVVNGTAIMSMSMFCDMARSAAQYAYQRAYPDQAVPDMSIYNVEMTHALVVQNRNPEQIVKTKVTFSGTAEASITFSSTTKGTDLVEHGSMRIVFEDSQAWFAEQKQTAYLIGARIRSLKDVSSQGSVHRLLKPVIYRLFSNLVAYGEDYRAMDEVWVDGDCQDAAANIKLPKSAGKGNFLYDPFWSDGAVHLGGFLLNGGLKYDDDTVCLCTGLASWRFIEHLRGDETYTTYTAIQDTETPSQLSGSAYIFDSHNKLVQVATGMVFQKMNKATMAVVLKTGSPHRSPGVDTKQVEVRLARGSTRVCEPMATLTHSAPLTQVVSSRSDLGNDSGYATPERGIPTDGMQSLISIISSECGCNDSDLESSTAFSDVGVDSLMAITIIASFRKRTGIELPVTFFLDHQTVQEAKEALVGSSPGEAKTAHENHSVVASTGAEATLDGMASSTNRQSGGSAHEQPVAEIEDPLINIALPLEEFDSSATSVPSWLRHSFSSSPSSSSLADCSESSATSVPTITEENVQPAKPSQTILLHGSPSSEGAKLFLLPDGGGSPGCYIGLPSLHSSLNIYAVQSPYVKCPAELTCSMRALCESFVQAIQGVQPTGPYLLGGYSYGALYAYEVTRILLERGLAVDGMFIIDMAVPKPIELPCSITQQLLLESGLLPSKGPVSPAQKEHYLNTVRMMVSYKPNACLTLQPKRTILLTSKEPLASGKQSSLATWAQGASSTTRGWEKLVAGTIERKDVEGTHFTLLKYPNVSQDTPTQC
jgi:iron transport multicopper oxidase